MRAFTVAKRAEFLEHIREGMMRGAAADALELDRRGVRAFILKNPEFEKAVLDAELDATEHVQEALYQAAVSGNVAAAKTWLELKGVGETRAVGRPATPAPAGPPGDRPFSDLDNVTPLDRRRRK